MAVRRETGPELNSAATVRRSSTAEWLPGTSATRASATTRTSRYPWSTRWDAKFIASSFTGIPPTTKSNAGEQVHRMGGRQRDASSSNPPIDLELDSD